MAEVVGIFSAAMAPWWVAAAVGTAMMMAPMWVPAGPVEEEVEPAEEEPGYVWEGGI